MTEINSIRRDQDQHFTVSVPNISQFSDFGVCPYILSVMTDYLSDAALVVAGLKCITNISSMSQSNKSSFR